MAKTKRKRAKHSNIKPYCGDDLPNFPDLPDIDWDLLEPNWDLLDIDWDLLDIDWDLPEPYCGDDLPDINWEPKKPQKK